MAALTHKEFTDWLTGYFEVHSPETLTEAQVELIQKKLNEVLGIKEKVKPAESVKINPTPESTTKTPYRTPLSGGSSGLPYPNGPRDWFDTHGSNPYKTRMDYDMDKYKVTYDESTGQYEVTYK